MDYRVCQAPIRHISKESTTCYYRDFYLSIYFPAVLYLGRKWKHPKCSSTKEHIIKIWYSNAEVYFISFNKNEMIKFTGRSSVQDCIYHTAQNIKTKVYCFWKYFQWSPKRSTKFTFYCQHFGGKTTLL